MNYRAVGAAAAATLCALAAPASGEVLAVSGIYPARNDAAAPLERIAIGSFGGRDGEVLSFAIEDRLRGVTVDGSPWFRVLPEGGDADAVLRGMASLEWTDSRVKQKREVCVEENGDGKCQRKEYRDVECTAYSYRLMPRLRLVAMNGDLIHSDDAPEYDSVTQCPGDRYTRSRKDIARDLAGRIAVRVRLDLAPEQRIDNVRVLEKRDGLSKEDGLRFKSALKLTKSDPAAACRAWQQIADTNPGQVSTLFNLALCAESSGDDREARSRYEALLRQAAVPQAEARLDAIGARAQARHQLSVHSGG